MSDESSPATPANGQTSVQNPTTQQATPPAAAQAAPPPAPPKEPIGITSEQLKERLEETRTKTAEKVRADLLKEIGITDPALAKKKLADLDKLESEKLSELERRDKEIADLKPKAERVSAIEKAFNDLVEEQFKALPKDVQKAIDASAQGNAEQRLAMMRVAAALTPAAPPTTQVEPLKPPPIQPGATTAPNASAPHPAVPHTENHLAEWERLNAPGGNAFAAHRYYEVHKLAINAAKRARLA